MNRLRNRLIFVFVIATLLPLGLTLWTTLSLIERSLGLAPFAELDSVSASLERTGRELYKESCDILKREAEQGRIEPRKLKPSEAQSFWDRGAASQFELAGERGSRLDYLVRRGGEVWVYSRPMGVAMDDLTDRIAQAHQALNRSEARNLRRGFSATLLLVASTLWLAALSALIFLAHRISRPVQQLTQGLKQVASGDLAVRLEPGGSDEIGAAVDAFNHMAAQLQQARERLIHVTRLASWQALARKMAHEVKNSLTPIRLTMEEIVSRGGPADGAFLEQAAQIVADEVQTLERRVRAFSQFAAEPPVMPGEIDVNALVEERVSFLKAAHPEVTYLLRLAPDRPVALADPDLIKGVLTNLLENAAEAARPGGVVLAATSAREERLSIEVHDSGPGLSPQARASLFEPTISFKKGGMGLGLSIARRSALLCGGDIEMVESELGGAGFRVILSGVRNGAAANSHR
ncbi:MAG TPA: HAMP domain-containing protein [Bryobacteraceae bacterium]|jgi:two-component system nitrogen regulation sensor histidine kinase NtrY|nr:HAMP domain-containing protein [Bryobacteraceae bacterium]